MFSTNRVSAHNRSCKQFVMYVNVCIICIHVCMYVVNMPEIISGENTACVCTVYTDLSYV